MEIEVELKTKLEQLYSRVESLKDQIKTEEATKNAFIMPFLQILGYDVFNPTEVIPEFVADIGTKKGEKVDYVIKKDDQVILIVECKHWKDNVEAYTSQLHRYYHVTDTRFAIITNGIVYNFFMYVHFVMSLKKKYKSLPMTSLSCWHAVSLKSKSMPIASKHSQAI